MKILILGSGKSYGIENAYRNAFIKGKSDCDILPTADIFWDSHHKNVLTKVLGRLGFNKASAKIHKLIVDRVSSFKPSLIMVFKGMEIQTKTLSLIKDKGIPTINFNPDDPFSFGSFASGNKNVLNNYKYYAAHFCYKKENLEKFKSLNTSAYWLPFAYDHINYSPVLVDKKEEVLSACFIGNPDQIRVETINAVAKELGNVDVFGIGWENQNMHENVTLKGLVLNSDYHKSISKYRSQINIFRQHNLNSTNMRVFEIWGNFGLGMNPYSSEINELHPPDVEYCFKDTTQLIEGLKRQLNMTYEQAKEIRVANHEFCLHGHTYLDRAKQILKTAKDQEWI